MNLTTETKVIIGIVVATIVLISGGVYLTARNAPPEAKATLPVEQTLSSQNYSKGNKEAKVKIVEFSDFQCPACGASEPIVKQVLNEYGDRIYFEYNHFPLTNHRWAIEAGEASEVAGEMGKFWEMHDIIFLKQAEWSASDNAGNQFKAYAKEIGLDEAKFNEGYDSHKYRQKVLDAMKRGEALAVSSTPTFFMNGERVVGGIPFTEWKSKIDAALQ